MKLRLWGTRGSVARAGEETIRYGGDTASVEVQGRDGSILLLDAGSGLLRASAGMASAERIDLLITHLHMDHVQGLGFFPPLRRAEVETHIWGPISTTESLEERLRRYLSPPLFPVRVRDLQEVHLHDVGPGTYEIGPFRVTADLIIHPGPTLGFRIEENGGGTLAYLPDHEPALGHVELEADPRWTSGFDLARGADVLIHDAQYTEEEYLDRIGWGHSTLQHAIALATLAEVATLVPFHHDPEHSDDMLDEMMAQAEMPSGTDLVPGKFGLELEV
ncbi:MAG TPA: MBL fold metallo-hydrolase [Acidimicrobiia bacterium]|nr:MBL fold metallo-hydrolase [Acidimicrobiia bacterium]